MEEKKVLEWVRYLEMAAFVGALQNLRQPKNCCKFCSRRRLRADIVVITARTSFLVGLDVDAHHGTLARLYSFNESSPATV